MAYVDMDFGVIKDARRRQRRRRLLTVGVLVVGVLAVAIAWTRGHPSSAPSVTPSPPAPLPSVAPGVAFWRAPYMGVSCPPTPNSIACDRVGIAVWLRRPALAVTATIAGTTIPLHTGEQSLSQWQHRPPRTGFTGYLQPAGLLTTFHVSRTLTWFGAPTPSTDVRFRINYGHGHIVTTHQRVPLMPGWG